MLNCIAFTADLPCLIPTFAQLSQGACGCCQTNVALRFGDCWRRVDEPQIQSQAARSVSPFHFFTGDHLPCGAGVCPVSAFAAERRGPAVRAWDRHLSRDRASLVEPLRTDVRGGHPDKTEVVYCKDESRRGSYPRASSASRRAVRIRLTATAGESR